jgi:hypothetical protein
MDPRSKNHKILKILILMDYHHWRRCSQDRILVAQQNLPEIEVLC